MQDRVSEPASGNAMAAELERVLYAQMLVLFAPQAVPAAAHLPLLVHTLQAAQPALRQAAAATLRHLAGQCLRGGHPSILQPVSGLHSSW